MRSSAITSALINKLLADAPLMALTPDGVFFGVAGPSMVDGGTAKRFVIISPVTAVNVPVFQRRAYLDGLYLVEARMLSTSVPNALTRVHDAAERIDAILDPQPPEPPATLTVPGFELMTIFQEDPTELIEFDDADSSIQWFRGGGNYRAQLAVAA
jgi:hypothetical protein